MKTQLTQSALQDCAEILTWYQSQGHGAGGAARVAQLLQRIEQLERFPQSGRIVPEFQCSELRELIEPPFRIVYRLTSTSLTVIRIWRGERQLQLPPLSPAPPALDFRPPETPVLVVTPESAREQRLRAALAAPRPPLPPRQRQRKLGTTGFMLAMHVGAVAALLPMFWSWQGLVALAALYWATVLGVTLGLHRLLAHRSFEAPRWLERSLVLMGTLACQSGPIEWVGLHRHHHRYSDQPNDHHDAARGLWWAHGEWMLHEIPALRHVERLTGDLQIDPFYRWLDRWFLLLQLPLGAALYWYGQRAGVHGGGLGLVLWAIPLRLVLVYHVTWLVNSATHAWGYRTFNCPDRSRNCWWVAILSFGEGWHNNHHAFPHSARHGLRWFELDITWQHIRLLQTLGWAKRVRLARY